MIDKTLLEHQALTSALRLLGETVAEIGMDKPLSAYTREEVLSVSVLPSAYFRQYRTL